MKDVVAMATKKDIDGSKRVIAVIPQETHQAVKILCAMRNVTMNQYFIEALAHKLAQDESRQ